MTSRARGATLPIKVETDTRQSQRAFRSIEGDVRQADAAASKSTATWKGFSAQVAAVGTAFVAMNAGRWALDAISLGQAAAEVDTKFEAVFGSAEDFRTELEQIGRLAGVSKVTMADLASTFGNLSQAQGISAGATRELTTDVATLAGDLASFNNADPARVFEALTKGIQTTEREALKPFGIAITEAEVKQKALAIAMAAGRSEATKADRAFASYQIAVSQAGKAVGDLDRTQDSQANRTRQQRARLEDLQATIGTKLLPVYGEFLTITENLIPLLEDTVDILGPLAEEAADLASVLSIASGETEDWGDKLIAAGEAGLDWLARLNPLIDNTKIATIEFGVMADAFTNAQETLMSTNQGWGEAAIALATHAGHVGDAVEGEITDPTEEAIAALERLEGRLRSVFADPIRAWKRRQEEISINRLLSGGGGQEFHTGGVVPGAPGTEVPATLLAGETVLPTHSPAYRGRMGGANITYQVTVAADATTDKVALGEAVVDAIVAYERSAGDGWRSAVS